MIRYKRPFDLLIACALGGLLACAMWALPSTHCERVSGTTDIDRDAAHLMALLA